MLHHPIIRHIEHMSIDRIYIYTFQAKTKHNVQYPISKMDKNCQSRESVKCVPLSYATCSIGNTEADTLPRKLEAISNAGFTAIELAFPDIIDYGSQLLGHQIESSNYNELVTIATDIRQLCVAKNLKIMMLQPFANFEGWPRDSQERKDAFARAEGWVKIMEALETDILQVSLVPSFLSTVILINTRLVQPIFLSVSFHKTLRISSPTSVVSAIYSRATINAWLTKIGAGRLMPRHGKMPGTLLIKLTAQILVSVWIPSRLLALNGVILQHLPDGSWMRLSKI